LIDRLTVHVHALNTIKVDKPQVTWCPPN